MLDGILYGDDIPVFEESHLNGATMTAMGGINNINVNDGMTVRTLLVFSSWFRFILNFYSFIIHLIGRHFWK